MHLDKMTLRIAGGGVAVIVIFVAILGIAFAIQRGTDEPVDPNPAIVAEACEIWHNQTFRVMGQLPAIMADEVELRGLISQNVAHIATNEDTRESIDGKWNDLANRNAAVRRTMEASLTPMLQSDDVMYDFVSMVGLQYWVMEVDLARAGRSEGQMDAGLEARLKRSPAQISSSAATRGAQLDEVIDAFIAECE